MKFSVNSFIFLLMALTISSCNVSSDDNPIEPPNFEVLGLWDLVEVNISEGQDLNTDGTLSTNVVDELDCLSGTLLIDGDLQWTFDQVGLSVTTITGGLFEINCIDATSATGTWFSNETSITFSGDPALSTMQIEGDKLVNTVGENLPGVLSYVYERRIVN
ncbi:hypothetical protein [Spongiimicrobium sp. 3-5]|uniref:hypothetical protein n=1 Tax=Spongiimicrobium sp. 3-5 TaxID=3332596 RepID=UPI0039818870